MIAPLRLTEEAPAENGLQSARRMVAEVLLEHAEQPLRDVPPLPAWRAWLFVGWVVLVAIVYCTHLAGLF